MSRKGFTIIEVLVVILIMGLIMGVGAVSYRDFQRKQMVVAAKRTVLADVRAAAADVASGRKPDGCTGTLTGYSFEVMALNPASYKINAVCDGGTALVKEVRIPGISFDSLPIVTFLPLSEGTDLSSPVTLTILSSSTSYTEKLEISPSGVIK